MTEIIKKERFRFYSKRGRGRISPKILQVHTEANTKEIVIRTLAEYVNYLEKNHIDKMVLFRGQELDWPLIPKIARLKLNYENPTILDAEQRMFNEFKKTSMPFQKAVPNSSWDWLALAQHHGMATRLFENGPGH